MVQKDYADLKIFWVGCLVFVGVIFVCVSMTLPIVILVYAKNFRTEIICTSTIAPSNHINLANTIGIYQWLIVHGAIGIVEVVDVVLYFATKFCAHSTQNSCAIISWFVLQCFWVLIVFFRLAWFIVGSVMFWRDCPNLYPNQMNDLMWATLIIGFVGLLISFGIGIAEKLSG